MSDKRKTLRLFQRGPDKPRLSKDQWKAARRVAELTRIYRSKYPNGLPHNSLGVKCARYMCRTLSFLPNNNREQWLDRYAHWLDGEQRQRILRLGPYWYAARSLGEHLELYDVDREELQTWSIEACDVTEEQRAAINQEKHRKREETRRWKAGAKPRADSLSRTQPWLALNISRRTWERRRKAVDANSCQPSFI